MRSLLASIHPVSHCGAVNALSVAGQRGQAMMEGLLILMLLALLWVAVAWLGHLQDMALSAQHASRHVAFLLTRKPADDMLGPVLQQHFTGPAHQWSDRRGKPMLGGHGSVQHDTDRQSVLAQAAQPGGDDPSAGSLRRSWGLQDEGILTAKVRVTPQSWANLSARGNFASGLNDFNKYPVLHRHTAILTGAGHAGNDARAAHIVAQSPLAWGDSATISYALGKKIGTVMGPVDTPWHRDHPVFDWLTPWKGDVPAARLADAQQGGQ